MTASLNSAIRELIQLHGRDEVRKEANRLTKVRVRDKLVGDNFAVLSPFIEQEARNWLDKKPRTSNVKIANQLSALIKGQSEDAVRRRLLSRLSVTNPDRIF